MIGGLSKNKLLFLSGYLVFIFLFIAVFLPFTGGPKTWDELLYLNLSLNTEANPIILFRYTHIYFQKIFIAVFSSDVILASKIFWLFLCGTTAWIIARVSYKLSGSFIAPVVALYFFFMQNLVFQKYPGVTYADFTVMFFGTLMLSIYYGSKSDKIKLSTLTFLFVLVFKCKETSAPFILLPLTVLFKMLRNKEFRSLTTTLYGGLAALLLFILLDAIFLKDPLFSVAPRSFSARAGFDLFVPFERTTDNWFGYILKSTLLMPFIFYLVYLTDTGKSFYDTIVSFVPIFILLLLIVSMISGSWGIEDRYVLPAIPYLCIFGGIAFTRPLYPSNENGIKTALSFIVIFVLAFCLSHLVEKFLTGRFRHFGWENHTLHLGIILPLSILLLLIGFSGKRFIQNRWVYTALIIFPIMLYSASDLKANIIALKRKDAITETEKRFEPFITYKNELRLGSIDKLGVSKSIYNNSQMLGRDEGSLVIMYNVFFNTNSKGGQIKLDSLTSTAQFTPYTKILLSNKDTFLISDSAIPAKFDIKKSGETILLIKKTAYEK